MFLEHKRELYKISSPAILAHVSIIVVTSLKWNMGVRSNFFNQNKSFEIGVEFQPIVTIFLTRYVLALRLRVVKGHKKSQPQQGTRPGLQARRVPAGQFGN